MKIKKNGLHGANFYELAFQQTGFAEEDIESNIIEAGKSMADILALLFAN